MPPSSLLGEQGGPQRGVLDTPSSVTPVSTALGQCLKAKLLVSALPPRPPCSETQ